MNEDIQIFRASTVLAAKPQPGFKEIKKRDPGDIILIRKKGVILTFETSGAGGAPLRMRKT